MLFHACRSRTKRCAAFILALLWATCGAAQEAIPLEDFEDCEDTGDNWICENFDVAQQPSLPNDWQDLSAGFGASLSRVVAAVGLDGHETRALQVQSLVGVPQGIYRRVGNEGPVYTAQADVLVVKQIETGAANLEVDIAFADPPTPIEFSQPWDWTIAGMLSGGYGLWGFSAWTPVEQNQFGNRLVPGRWYRITVQVNTMESTLTAEVVDLAEGTIFAFGSLFLPSLSGKMYSVVYFGSRHQGDAGSESTVLFDNLLYSDGSDGLKASIDQPNEAAGCTSVGEEVRFEGSAMTLEGPTKANRYVWNFGDGSTSEGGMVTHVYDQCGRYLVTLTVTAGAFSRVASRLICISGRQSDKNALSPWTALDIGAPAFPGSSLARGNGDERCFELCAGGAFVTSAMTDQLHFIQQELAGDLILTARVSQIGEQGLGRIGIMVRESLASGARYSAVVLRQGASSRIFESIRRDQHDHRSSSSSSRGVEVSPPDAWLRLERHSDEIIGSWSTDGLTWTELNRVTFGESLPEKLFYGMVAIGNDSNPHSVLKPMEATLCDVRYKGLPSAPSFRRGDANFDDRVDISDAQYILNFLFLGGRAILCSDAADANDDGGVDISDAQYVLNHLFLGGAAPPPPFPTAGADLTEDNLTCM
jgi:PKD repeat protein